MTDQLRLPPKKDVALALIQTENSVYVHLDPRAPGVMVPAWFKNQPQLVLQIGMNLAVPIPDLDIGEEALSCTLSFNRRPEYCYLPYTAIFGLVGEGGRGMIWPDSVPPEVAAQAAGRAAAAKPAAEENARPRPRLVAVPRSTERSEEEPTRTEEKPTEELQADASREAKAQKAPKARTSRAKSAHATPAPVAGIDAGDGVKPEEKKPSKRRMKTAAPKPAAPKPAAGKSAAGKSAAGKSAAGKSAAKKPGAPKTAATKTATTKTAATKTAATKTAATKTAATKTAATKTAATKTAATKTAATKTAATKTAATKRGRDKVDAGAPSTLGSSVDESVLLVPERGLPDGASLDPTTQQASSRGPAAGAAETGGEGRAGSRRRELPPYLRVVK